MHHLGGSFDLDQTLSQFQTVQTGLALALMSGAGWSSVALLTMSGGGMAVGSGNGGRGRWYRISWLSFSSKSAWTVHSAVPGGHDCEWKPERPPEA